MPMLQPMNLEQMQTSLEQWIQQFQALVARAEDLKTWSDANLTEANRNDGYLVSSTNLPITAKQLADLKAAYDALGTIAQAARNRMGTDKPDFMTFLRSYLRFR